MTDPSGVSTGDGTSVDETAEETDPPFTVHVHEWSEWVVISEVSCYVDGCKEKTCECGAKETLIYKVHGHFGGAWVTELDPTCTLEGSKHQECTVCDAEIKVQSIAALGHTAGDVEAPIQ